MLLAIADRLAGVVTRIGRLASWLAIALMLVILTDVVTRRFLVLGSGRLQDLEWHLHGALFLLCFGFAYVRDAHVRIELVRDHMSARLRAGLEIAGILLFLVPFCVLVIKFGIEFAERSYRTGETSMGWHRAAPSLDHQVVRAPGRGDPADRRGLGAVALRRRVRRPSGAAPACGLVAAGRAGPPEPDAVTAAQLKPQTRKPWTC